MNQITDTKQIILSPSGADSKNGNLNSKLYFNIPGFIKKDKYIIYNTIKIMHAEFPYSFYIVNEYNNILNLSSGQINIPYGNYNANSFMKAIQPLLPTYMTITFNSLTGVFSFQYDRFFSILSTTTCYELLGLVKNKTYTSNSNIIICEFPANFLGTKNIFIKCPNIILENYNTKTKDYITLKTLPVNVAPFGKMLYENSSSSKNLIKNTQLDNLQVEICDDNNNLIDFNGIEWNITIEIESVIQVMQNLKTISEYLADLNQ